MTRSNRSLRARWTGSLILGAAIGLTALATQNALRAAEPQTAPLPGHRPAIVLQSRAVARVTQQESVRLAITLPIFNQPLLSDYLKRIYTPGDPLYGQFMTPETFANRFGPGEADYAAVAAYARANGLTVVGTHTNRLVLDVAGPASAVEKAFGTRLMNYQAPDGRVFRAPETEPVVPTAIASKIAGVIGLDTAGTWKPHNKERPIAPGGVVTRDAHPNGGSGPGGGLTPKDIKTAYNLTGASQTGAGQALGVFELTGYKASDIAAYEQAYGLPSVPLQNVLVDGVSGSAGSGADEVTLDIELQIAVAPGASKVLVYEGPNSTTGVIDTYNRIATDNLAKQISTSWGLDESSTGASTRNAENTIFQQMAAQGQSIYAAAGDAGAYDNGSTLSVDDPASQPYMTGVGGTTLTTGTGAVYQSEKTWNGGSPSRGAGGGGISQFWPIPSYQAGVVSASSKGSTTFRNVPDVALNADPATGYSIYYNGGWHVYGGTSCAAPLWAGFTALINQQRIANSSGLLGFANPTIYGIGQGTNYAADFHDIADNSTNLYYPAVAGYDEATGWGSFNGAGLLADLIAGTGGSTGGGGGTPPPAPSQLLGNPGFENGSNASPWVASGGVITNSTAEPAHGGSWKAWLDGYGHSHTDTLSQQVSIPGTVTSATLTFWLHIDTAETTSGAADTLTVQIRSASGAVLSTLATYSNANAAPGYAQKTFDLSAFKGQTIQITLTGVENNKRQTSFVVDDFALNVQ